jgi:hypothetical protein
MELDSWLNYERKRMCIDTILLVILSALELAALDIGHFRAQVMLRKVAP